jgi:AraC family transcriptional regulator
MQVTIVTFPQTRVAMVIHRGAPTQEHDTARKLIAWKIENRLLDPVRNRSYGLHYADPSGPEASKYRVDFCLSIENPVLPNTHGIVESSIPSRRCALARDIGSRANNQAARYLYEQWLPSSGEKMSGHPLIFHYVTVGPNVPAQEAITDVYMPIL